MSSINSLFKDALEYQDVFIIPQFSNISTRQKVDISSNLGATKIEIPVISANMESVTNAKLAIEIGQAGAIGALHRFQSVEDACEEYGRTVKNSSPALVSVGVGGDAFERTKALYEWGARSFIIDIAHGHSKQMKAMIEHLRSNYKDIYIIAGNVATPKATRNLFSWGTNAVKIGIGPGSVCLTKNVTGVTVPAFTSIMMCVEEAKSWEQSSGNKTTIIADGGMVEIGDICKALGAGADFIMTGRMFAGCVEAPNGTVYRGSASKDVQAKYRKGYLPTPEGASEILENAGPAKDVIKNISGGIKSTFSYCGASTMKEFHENCSFGIKYNTKK